MNRHLSRRSWQWNSIQIYLFCGFVFWSLPVVADWQLDAEQSSLQFISSKLVQGSHATIFEINQFDRFSGGIDQQQTWLTVETASVNTKVPIRDERIREHVFKSDRYPQAKVQAAINAAAVEKIKPGGMHTQDVKGTLTLLNQTHPVSARVNMIRLDADTLVLQTQTPALLNTRQYQMQEGFLKLKELVNLFHIPMTILVDFRLVFQRAK